jgi:hypothetical protein
MDAVSWRADGLRRVATQSRVIPSFFFSLSLYLSSGTEPQGVETEEKEER